MDSIAKLREFSNRQAASQFESEPVRESPWERQQRLNEESKERVRRGRERREERRKNDNTGEKPIQDDGVDKFPRRVIVPPVPQSAEETSFPWKVTANGDNTVAVAAGSLLSYDDIGPNTGTHLYEIASYDGTNSIDVDGSGYIYGSISSVATTEPLVNITLPTSGDPVTILRVIPNSADSISVTFEATRPTPTGAAFYWEIAQVALTDGVASVTKQTLNHNPAPWSIVESS